MQIRSATFPAQPFFDAGLTKGWEEIYRGVQPASLPADWIVVCTLCAAVPGLSLELVPFLILEREKQHFCALLKSTVVCDVMLTVKW